MSKPVFTEREMNEFKCAVEILIGYHQGIGLRPCFVLYTEVTGWDRLLYVCACEFPYYEVGASPH